MSKTQYYVGASLDGFIADRDNRIDWLTAFDGTEGLTEHYEAFIADVGALAMGSLTYEFLLQHGGPWPYPGLPSFVFTRRELPAITAPGADVRFVHHKPAEPAELDALHAHMLAESRGKNLWLVGGGQLAGQFQRRGLIDELWLSMIPVVLGGGAPLFGDAAVPRLELCQVTQFGRGIVELRYRLGRA